MGEKKRCAWASSSPLMRDYHDREWGDPEHSDDILFEFLLLESFQSGLSWEIILKKRENFRTAFDGFDPGLIARYGDRRIEVLMGDKGIVRNRRKIESAVTNARAAIRAAGESGSFDSFIWGLAGGSTHHNAWKSISEIPVSTPRAAEMSRRLKESGFTFVGPVVCYSFMQAVGMVNDHEIGCYRHRELNP
jgi:DNA-3-methyladenine glycosylase I